jgi:hypothetical protein
MGCHSPPPGLPSPLSSLRRSLTRFLVCPENDNSRMTLAQRRLRHRGCCLWEQRTTLPWILTPLPLASPLETAGRSQAKRAGERKRRRGWDQPLDLRTGDGSPVAF